MGDSVYVGSCNGLFRRLSTVTGAVQWATDVCRTAPRYFFHGDVFRTRNRIIAPADVDASSGQTAGVHSFDQESGRQVWMYPAGRGVLGAVVGTPERAFAYAASGDLIAIDIETGKAAWTHPLKAPSWESPGLMLDRVIGGSSDGTLSAFQTSTGTMEWQVSLGAAIDTSIRAGVGTDVVAGSVDGRLHRVSASDGTRLASLTLDSKLRPKSVPVVSSDSILVLLADSGADYRAVVAVDPELSRIKWRRDATDLWSTSRVFTTERLVVLGTPKGFVEAFCRSNGAPAWSHQLANDPIRVIGGSDETLYVGTPQGSLFAVQPPPSCQ